MRHYVTLRKNTSYPGDVMNLA